ncbi:hypothetical protein [Streptosporangium fragile]|uniref:hypothetical protein n=1 Tax=Streptosporangium fragile TaxID=46186 RepID=UPI0031E7412F
MISLSWRVAIDDATLDHVDGTGDLRDRCAVAHEYQALTRLKGIDEGHDVLGKAGYVDSLSGAFAEHHD